MLCSDKRDAQTECSAITLARSSSRETLHDNNPEQSGFMHNKTAEFDILFDRINILNVTIHGQKGVFDVGNKTIFFLE